MSIDKLTEFAKLADENSSNTEGLNLEQGFPSKLQPARQWFNWLLNKLTLKVNEVIDSHNSLQNNLIDKIYPVGVIIEFATEFDPNAHFLGTTWVRHAEGLVSVGLSSSESDPEWTRTLGSTFGDYQHALTVSELPEFQAETVMFRAGYVPSNGDWIYTGGTAGFANDSSPDSAGIMKSKVIGEGLSHSIVQPSIVDARWRRTA
ncbi:phage baseplate protein [Acinetobacter haemolyticus]|uniref:phage baseplate protein n=1 Tax=Acinetobacter haemolyticus TaxID=29430 RepID=UPI003EF6DFB8